MGFLGVLGDATLAGQEPLALEQQRAKWGLVEGVLPRLGGILACFSPAPSPQ